MSTPTRTVAIIGIGPRGSFALESYINELSERKLLTAIHILLFDAQGKFGYGPVYELTQNDADWLNISERILLLEARPTIQYKNITIPSFPSYHEWTGKDFTSKSKDAVDHYPKRSKLGLYLQERLQSLILPLQQEKLVRLISSKVEKVEKNNHQLFIQCEDGNNYKNVDEVLLTIGHQPTKTSTQLADWKKFINNNKNLKLYTAPYPLSAFLNDNLDYNASIGIRGFGLAMIDVMRGIATELGQLKLSDTQTRKYNYSTTQDLKNLIIPFSLDGLPAVPKPLNATIDDWFKPNENEIKSFEDQIGDPQVQKEAKDFDFLIEAFAPIAATLFLNLPQPYTSKTYAKKELTETIKLWLKDSKHTHPSLVDNNTNTYKLMQEFVGMATMKQAISLDYCIGQVWRHCQPSIYDKLSFNNCSDEAIASIIELDERVKRYSFGPPVDSIQQIIALVDAEVLNLDWVNNPKIELSNTGWELKNNQSTIMVKTMINSVIDSPVIKAVNSPLVKHLLANDVLKAVHDDLGIETDDNGYILVDEKSEVFIAVLGRLAKGTIIGVDAILECFGKRPQAWAAKATDHHERFLKNQ